MSHQLRIQRLCRPPSGWSRDQQHWTASACATLVRRATETDVERLGVSPRSQDDQVRVAFIRNPKDLVCGSPRTRRWVAGTPASRSGWVHAPRSFARRCLIIEAVSTCSAARSQISIPEIDPLDDMHRNDLSIEP